MQQDGMGLIGEAKVVFDGNLNEQETIEGPKLYKRNGWYYIFAPAGGVKTGWQNPLSYSCKYLRLALENKQKMFRHGNGLPVPIHHIHALAYHSALLAPLAEYN